MSNDNLTEVNKNDDSQYAFTEDASLAIAGLDTESTGYEIPSKL